MIPHRNEQNNAFFVVWRKEIVFPLGYWAKGELRLAHYERPSILLKLWMRLQGYRWEARP